VHKNLGEWWVAQRWQSLTQGGLGGSIAAQGTSEDLVAPDGAFD
jgi:hypothetical protein